MIAALQKSRSSSPEEEMPINDAAVPEADANPGEVLIEKLSGLETKLDVILKILGAGQQEEPEAVETDAKEPTE